MKSAFSLLILFTACAGLASAEPLVFEGTNGIGKGKHIVFVAGDHEYRSEESLPALARLLAKHHGFKCTVLFNIDPESGEIVAGTPSSIPHMEALDTADLAVVFLRFQNLPAEQMKHFDAYLNRGGPVVGMRTATHSFSDSRWPTVRKVRLEEQGSRLRTGLRTSGPWSILGWSLWSQSPAKHSDHHC